MFASSFCGYCTVSTVSHSQGSWMVSRSVYCNRFFISLFTPCDAGEFFNKCVSIEINVKVFIKVMESFKVRPSSYFAANSCL